MALSNRAPSDFHNSPLARATNEQSSFATYSFSYAFETFFHPFVGDLIARLNRTSIQQTLDPTFLSTLSRGYDGFYDPTQATSEVPGTVVQPTIDPAKIDVSLGGPYAVYNWELFYHIPIMIAVHLTRNQRFAEAQSWFHLVFDPTFTDASSSTDGATYPYWKFIGFRPPTPNLATNTGLVETLADILSYTGSDQTQLDLQRQVLSAYNQIFTTPFDPHAVARTRPLAYQYYVVMKYLDNLIAWGDSLFVQDTIETINEATLCYVMAANLLGPRPQKHNPLGTVPAQNYYQLQARGMRELLSPAAVSDKPDTLHIFDTAEDGRVYHKFFVGGWFPNGITGDWECIGGLSAGGRLAGPPAVVSDKPDTLHIFGTGEDGRVYHKFFVGGWFPNGIAGDWECIGGLPAGGRLAGPPAVVSDKPDTLHIFGTGEDGRVYHKFFVGGWFPNGITGDWECIGGLPAGGRLAGPPAVVSDKPDTLHVFGAGQDDRVHHKFFVGGWFPDGIGGDWECIGGLPAGGRLGGSPKMAQNDLMGNALVDLEAQFPFNMSLAPGQTSNGNMTGPLFGIGRTLYFCFPPNEKLLSYWDTVADRLFKIRHCENIAGLVRQLPLFDAPIDPGMLIKAQAAGIDVGTIVSGLNQPVSPVRCSLLIQKALELANEVRSFGSALLSAIEKADSEHLALLRQSNECQVQQASQNVRFLQWKQAQEATQSLLRTRATTLQRYAYYLRVLGQSPDATNIPDTFDTSSAPQLTEATFDDVYQTLVAQYDRTITLQHYPSLNLTGTESPANQSGASGLGQLYLNTNEDAELNVHLPAARDTRLAASVLNVLAGVLTYIPDCEVDLQFWGLGGNMLVFGGSKLAEAMKYGAEVLQIASAYEQDQAGIASRTASYQRRADDWIHQGNLAARELMQIGRQIIGSLIAEQVAYHEYKSAQMQVSQAQDLQTFMQQKFTNEQLYIWMQGQLSALYYQYYRLACDTARKTEQTMKRELMRPELDTTSFIKVNYWDTGRQGLLSGEALHLDLKRMEIAYYDNNRRELEVTRHVSLRQLNPVALLALRTTGQCTFTVPEWFFDRECPGHYMRRIKSVALSLPSVVGPYTTVNCTLTLQSSSVRTSSQLLDNKYGRRQGSDDSRFIDYFGAVESIVTSGASNDSGMFETNLRDERFLPFEGSGAVNSTWTLQLPQKFAPFDYTTISDAILHLRYTARQAGDPLASTAMSELEGAFSKTDTSALALLFLLPNDFPTEWAAFVASTAKPPTFTFRLRKDAFPYFVQGMTLTVNDTLLLYGADLKTSTQPKTPTTVNNDLKSSNGYADITLPGDSVLTTGATQAYLVIRYSATKPPSK
jgi:hypothetical protein